MDLTPPFDSAHRAASNGGVKLVQKIFLRVAFWDSRTPQGREEALNRVPDTSPEIVFLTRTTRH